MAYKRKTYRFKNAIEVEEYHDGRYGAPGEKRLKKKKATHEQIAKQNQINKENRIRRMIRKYFDVNDYLTDLTYIKDKRPPTMKAAKEDFAKFIRKVKAEYKKRGELLRWARNIEIGSQGGTHCHLVINRIPDTDLILKKCWEHGKVINQLLYEKGEFEELAKYVSKVPNEENRMQDASYSHSRNMPEVEPEIEFFPEKDIREEPRNRKNFYVDKNSVVMGINPVTGFLYRRYTLIRTVRRE